MSKLTVIGMAIGLIILSSAHIWSLHIENWFVWYWFVAGIYFTLRAIFAKNLDRWW